MHVTLSRQPVLHTQTGYAVEFIDVGGNYHQVLCQAMCGYQQIIGTNSLPNRFKIVADFGVTLVYGFPDQRRLQYSYTLCHRLHEQVRQQRVPVVVASGPRRYWYQAGTQAPCDRSISSKSARSASMSGNWSSTACNPERTNSNPVFLSGSTINLLPSFRMIASSPMSSKSLGIRTAWLRPLRNNLTCRFMVMGCFAVKDICLSICHHTPICLDQIHFPYPTTISTTLLSWCEQRLRSSWGHGFTHRVDLVV